MELKDIGRDISNAADRISLDNAKKTSLLLKEAIKRSEENTVKKMKTFEISIIEHVNKMKNDSIEFVRRRSKANVAEKINESKKNIMENITEYINGLKKGTIDTAKILKWVAYDGAPVGKAIVGIGYGAAVIGGTTINIPLFIGGFLVMVAGMSEATREVRRHKNKQISHTDN